MAIARTRFERLYRAVYQGQAALGNRKKSGVLTNVKKPLLNCERGRTTQGEGQFSDWRKKVVTVLGRVIWFHDELRMALIERSGGYTVGSVEEGVLTLGGLVEGEFRELGQTDIRDVGTDSRVSFLVEAEAMTEDEANELLGFLRT